MPGPHNLPKLDYQWQILNHSKIDFVKNISLGEKQFLITISFSKIMFNFCHLGIMSIEKIQ